MIKLQGKPEVVSDGGASTLLLWVCDLFDQDYSFRELLDKITEVLERGRGVGLTLPPEVPGEDFVEGTLRWGTATYKIYYERSLGYLELSNPSDSCTRELLEALGQNFEWS
jgi:hypothetical protein